MSIFLKSFAQISLRSVFYHISHNIKVSKILESKLSGAAGHEFVTGSSVVFSNSESRNTESYEFRQS